MDVEIQELVSSVHAVDRETALAPTIMEEIIRVVTAAIRKDLAHEQQLSAERRLKHSPRPLGDE
jgi:hypothetical protein